MTKCEKNVVERGTPQMAIWRVRIAYWIPKATNTHTSCVNSLLFYCNNGCTKAPQCYVIRTYIAGLFNNWHCVVSEDGTHVPQHAGIVLYLKMAHMYRNMLALCCI
jgi:hypothetical protein